MKVFRKLFEYKFKKTKVPISDVTFKNIKNFTNKTIDEINHRYYKISGLDKRDECTKNETKAKEIYREAEEKFSKCRHQFENIRKHTTDLEFKVLKANCLKIVDLPHKLVSEHKEDIKNFMNKRIDEINHHYYKYKITSLDKIDDCTKNETKAKDIYKEAEEKFNKCRHQFDNIKKHTTDLEFKVLKANCLRIVDLPYKLVSERKEGKFNFKKPIVLSDVTFKDIKNFMNKRIDEINHRYYKITGLDKIDECTKNETKAREIYREAEEKFNKCRHQFENIRNHTSDLEFKVFKSRSKENQISRKLYLDGKDKRKKYDILKDCTDKRKTLKERRSEKLQLWQTILIVIRIVGVATLTILTVILSYLKLNN